MKVLRCLGAGPSEAGRYLELLVGDDAGSRWTVRLGQSDIEIVRGAASAFLANAFGRGVDVGRWRWSGREESPGHWGGADGLDVIGHWESQSGDHFVVWSDGFCSFSDGSEQTVIEQSGLGAEAGRLLAHRRALEAP